jgi:hypothetical protein
MICMHWSEVALHLSLCHVEKVAAQQVIDVERLGEVVVAGSKVGANAVTGKGCVLVHVERVEVERAALEGVELIHEGILLVREVVNSLSDRAAGADGSVVVLVQSVLDTGTTDEQVIRGLQSLLLRRLRVREVEHGRRRDCVIGHGLSSHAAEGDSRV